MDSPLEIPRLQTCFCPACGSKVQAGIGACTGCGQDLALDASIRESMSAYVAAPPIEPVLTIEEPVSATFELPICPACGAKPRPGIRFCPKCGELLDESVSQRTYIVPPVSVPTQPLAVTSKTETKRDRKKLTAILILASIFAVVLIGCVVCLSQLFAGRDMFGFRLFKQPDDSMHPTVRSGSYVLTQYRGVSNVGDVVSVSAANRIFYAEDGKEASWGDYIPIARRVIGTQNDEWGGIVFVTKGDNKPAPDDPSHIHGGPWAIIWVSKGNLKNTDWQTGAAPMAEAAVQIITQPDETITPADPPATSLGGAAMTMHTTGATQAAGTTQTAETSATIEMTVALTTPQLQQSADGEPIGAVNKIGNSSVNIANGGQITGQGDWVYVYVWEDGIYKIKTDGTQKTRLVISKTFCYSLNVIGDWLYYTTNSPSGIHKIRTDGTGSTTISQARVYDGMIVTDAAIYYPASDFFSGNRIMRMAHDGSGITVILESTANFTIDGSRIYYAQPVVSDGPTAGLYSCDLSGNNRMLLYPSDTLSDYGVWNKRKIVVANGYIYFTESIDGTVSLKRVPANGGGAEIFGEVSSLDFQSPDGLIIPIANSVLTITGTGGLGGRYITNYSGGARQRLGSGSTLIGQSNIFGAGIYKNKVYYYTGASSVIRTNTDGSGLEQF